MARTSNVFARIEPELKEQAEIVLDQLGIPMSNAIGIFLKQVVMQRGIPFDVKVPPLTLPVCGTLTKEQLDIELEKGFADYRAGRTQNAADTFVAIEREYNI